MVRRKKRRMLLLLIWSGIQTDEWQKVIWFLVAHPPPSIILAMHTVYVCLSLVTLKLIYLNVYKALL